MGIKKKIFIEIGVPGYIRKRLMQKISAWKHLPVKWMKEENLHLTVAFVGYVDESVLPEICRKACGAADKFESFEILFDHIELGPDPKNPRLVRLSGIPSEELGKLNEEIEKTLGMRPQPHKEYRPHITLGRIKKLKWDDLEEKPVIDEKFNAAMTIESVCVMESVGDGAEYVSVEECPLI